MKYLSYFLALFLLFVSCEGDEPGAPEPVLPQRTIIAYLCGDNNLSSEIDTKIEALQEGMQRMGETNNHLIVYTDTRDEMPKLWQITATETKLLKEYVEMNSASATNFNQIFREIMQDYPAQSYGLICFSHASGWLPKGALNDPAGFATKYQENNLRSIFEDGENEMPLNEFANAIPLPANEEKLEFIIFETCYMAGIEVAWELRNKTKYIVASSAEMLSNGLAEIYPTHLTDLYLPNPDLKAFAQAYFNNWNNKKGTSRSATISVINPSHINPLDETIRTIYSSNKTEVNTAFIQHFNRNAYHLFFDLSDYLRTIATQEQFTAYENALSKVVEYQAATPQFMIGYPFSFNIYSHCGLTTYIRQEGFPELNEAYENLRGS